LEHLNFGRVEEALVLRALLAVRRKDPGRGFRQIVSAEVPMALTETASALRQAITFVKNTAQFPHIKLLPYKLPLATLALFFHEHREPSHRTRLLLTRWLWRGAISGAHRGDTVALRRTLDAIKAGDEEVSVQNLLAETGERPSMVPTLRPFNFRYARTKLQLVALAALGPRDIVTNDFLSIADLCEQQDGPALRLSSKNLLEEEEGLANRLLHPRVQGIPLRRRLASCENKDILRSHRISEESWQALRDSDFARFHRLREHDLQRYVGDFLESKSEWEASDRDRPALASLVVADE
jgi:hypothetical protein